MPEPVLHQLELSTLLLFESLRNLTAEQDSHANTSESILTRLSDLFDEKYIEDSMPRHPIPVLDTVLESRSAGYQNCQYGAGTRFKRIQQDRGL
jgi:hypothetical protein